MCAVRNIELAQANAARQLNPLVRNLGHSSTLAINERCAELRAQGRQIFSFGLGQSPFPVPPAMVADLRRFADRKEYLPTAGLPELRQAIAAYVTRHEGIQVDARQVVVAPGSKELMFILQLVREAQVLIPAPSWVSYAPQAGLFQRQVTWLPTSYDSNMRLTPAQLADACRENPDRPRLLILNYPSNPTGVTYDADQLAELAAVARQFDILVLSDEIYGGVNYSGDHVSIARFYPEGAIISNGLSKWCGAGGWRLGAFILPPGREQLRDAMVAVASETYSSVAAPIQHAAIRGFGDEPAMTQYLAGSRTILGALMKRACRALREAGVRVCEPQGGFYIFPDFTDTPAYRRLGGNCTAAEFCELILTETGVAILPGDEFGFPAAQPSARIALVDFDGDVALRALNAEADAEFLEQYCQPVMNGMARLCQWLAS
ncbi:MAG: aminotransferase class I/II-fold pyridoxal phosphate-dependent enzyme [Gammaproteobacteria bacterium]|nr:aminotransferase class I/II-fold pyridoxal phosphate-dependent enzyme [Gammaproteobacteria bacterium]